MREKMIDLAHDYFDSVPWYADIADLNPEELIDHLIANGVVPVVRCKDCEYRHDSCFAGSGNTYCDFHHKYFPLDGFCSYGERRTDE